MKDDNFQDIINNERDILERKLSEIFKELKKTCKLIDEPIALQMKKGKKIKEVNCHGILLFWKEQEESESPIDDVLIKFHDKPLVLVFNESFPSHYNFKKGKRIYFLRCVNSLVEVDCEYYVPNIVYSNCKIDLFLTNPKKKELKEIVKTEHDLFLESVIQELKRYISIKITFNKRKAKKLSNLINLLKK